jgi:hypothetical protein
MDKPFIDDEFAPISKRKSRLPTRAEWVIVALILGVQSSCLWAAVRNARRGPAGNPMPEALPDEAARVRHPLGFSMVVPPGWGPYTAGSEGVGRLSMYTRINKRKNARIAVTCFGRETPQLEGLRKTRFLGHEAYEKMEVLRPWTFDDGAWSKYTLWFRRGGDWYEIEYDTSEERTTVPPVIQRYLNTLRFDDRPPEAAP